MGRNNFGWRSREAPRAVTYALNAAASRGEVSYSTAATISERFAVAWQSLRDSGSRWLEDVSREQVEAYGQALAAQVAQGAMSPAYAQNLVSAVNTAMHVATRGQWASVSPTRDCGIAERSQARQDAPGALDRSTYTRAVDAVRSAHGERVAAVVGLCRELGLRSKEASLINARQAHAEALKTGYVTISDGTKGGRSREVPIASPRASEALSRAAAAQGGDRSMIPAGMSWREWREGPLRDARETVREHTGGGLHDLRSAWACERFEALSGHAAPVAGGHLDRQADRAAMQQLSAELGHGRLDVVASYIGRGR